MKSNNIILLGILCIFTLALLTNVAYALEDSRISRLNFSHFLYISNISTSPSTISQGTPSQLKLTLLNTGDEFLKDLRIKIDLPSQIAPYEDADQKKLEVIGAGSSKEIIFNIVALPSASEGVYKIPISINYLNFLADERQDNQTISILISNKPKVYAEVTSNEIYQTKPLGEIKVKVVNNNLANVKFLNIELMDSSDYEVLGYKREYIGDLNSDDFADSSFKIKVITDEKGNSPRTINIPIKLTYRDTFNQEYQEQLNFPFVMRSPLEMGIKPNYTPIILGVIVLLVIIYLTFKFYTKRKIRLAAKKGMSINAFK